MFMQFMHLLSHTAGSRVRCVGAAQGALLCVGSRGHNTSS